MPRLARILQAAAALVLLGLVGAALVFHLQGGRWFVTRTASMGTTAPVGSLVVDAAIGPGPLQVGDIITFRPPTAATTTYTHRIVAITDGRITTRGDANSAADGWQLTKADVVGRTVAVLPVAGWAVRAAPVLLAGTVLVWLLTRLLPASLARVSVRLVLIPLLVAATSAWLRPLANLALVAATAGPERSVITVVSTGILPVVVTSASGDPLRLTSGQSGSLTVATPHSGAHYAISTGLDLPVWGWLLVLLVCSVPVLIALVAGRRLTTGPGASA